MRRADPDRRWSETLQALTRQMLEDRELPMSFDGNMAIKNISGAFGFIVPVDIGLGRLRIVNRESGQMTEFATIDALLAAGWAVD